VTPKAKFLEWVNAFVLRNGLEGYRFEIPEENTVVVIPSLSRFSKPGLLQQFLDRMKPDLLLVELSRIHKATPEEFGYPITKDTFDEYFEIGLRDSNAIRFMSDFTDH
jgi:hypothetical protein